jgi:hypothetical protein
MSIQTLPGVYLAVILAGAAAGVSLHGQPLTAAEAEAAYLAAKPPPLAPGCYRMKRNKNVEYQDVRPEGKVYTRSETRTPVNGQWLTRVQIRNAEGTWHLYDQVAVLEPAMDGEKAKQELTANFPDAAKMFTGLEGTDKAEQERRAKLTPAEREKEDAAMRPIWFGDRFWDNEGQQRLQVRQRMSPAMVERVFGMFTGAVKHLPFLLRPIVKPFFAKIRDYFPVETEWTIDPVAHRILLTRTYSSAGARLQEMPPEVWEPCDAAGRFDIPPGWQQLRPKGYFECNRLQSKYAAEQAKHLPKKK